MGPCGWSSFIILSPALRQMDEEGTARPLIALFPAFVVPWSS
ncbi:uncharacterized, partial [Tachysurus ichikawai]